MSYFSRSIDIQSSKDVPFSFSLANIILKLILRTILYGNVVFFLTITRDLKENFSNFKKRKTIIFLALRNENHRNFDSE